MLLVKKMSNILRIENLEKRFGSQQVLKGINLNIKKGGITVIIGGSGCGKSVMMKHIIGLLKPDEGRIYLEDQNLVTASPDELQDARMRFGMLFQDAALFDSMNVFENISFPLREHRDYEEDVIEDIVSEKLKQVGLSGIEEKLVSELSGGMRKRVGLARAIVLNPEIILYDEPTTGLDPIMSQSIDDLIVETQQHLKGTSVIISHDIRATLRIANQIAMLHDGIIVEQGTPEEIRNSDVPVVRQFLETAMEAVLPGGPPAGS